MPPVSPADPCGPGKKFSLFAPIRSINMRTEIPGPKSRAIFERRATTCGEPPSQQRPIVVANAHGARVIDVDGNIFIDFAASTLVAGHTPQSVVEAVQAQAEALMYTDAAMTLTENEVRLCELLNHITPDMRGPKKTILTSGGVEALQQAFTLAQAFMGKSTIIPLTDRLQQSHTIASTSDIAAILIEPLDANFKSLDAQLIQDVAQQCRENNWLLIVDERQTGFGRTGKLFAAELYNLQPDLLVIGSALAGGIPLGAVTGRADVIAATPSTTGGHPLAWTAAISTIELIRDQNFPRRATQISEIVRERCAEWQQTFPQVSEIHGLEAMLALTLENPQIAARVIAEAIRNGLLLDASHADKCIHLLYPLMIPEEQLYEGLDVLEAALQTILMPDDV